MQYRSTPHTTTEVSPAKLCFNRPIRGKLNQLNSKLVNKHTQAQLNEERKTPCTNKFPDGNRANEIFVRIKYYAILDVLLLA